MVFYFGWQKQKFIRLKIIYGVLRMQYVPYPLFVFLCLPEASLQAPVSERKTLAGCFFIVAARSNEFAPLRQQKKLHKSAAFRLIFSYLRRVGD